MANQNPDACVEYIVHPSKGWVSLRLGELWQYRELLYFLTWRDIKVRYKQTAFGVAWAVLQPFLTMVIFTAFIGRVGKMPSDGIPYPLFAFAGLVPWTLFVYGLSHASESLVGGSNLVKKVYFPRLLLPIASVMAGSVDFVLAFCVLVGMILFYGHAITINILWIPLLLLLVIVASLGVGLWLSAMNVHFRDVRQMMPFLTQIWLLGTPIAYPSSLLKEPIRTLNALNPMTGVVEGFRWALLGANTSPGLIILISSLMAIALMVSGAFFFRRMEKSFADII
jgi:lipopolysaccharide transport system permease protein